LVKKYIFLIIFLLLNVISYAEETKNFEGEKNKSLQKSISPVFGYDPTSRYILGGAYFINLPEKRGFYLGTMVMGSTRSGYALNIEYKKWNEKPCSYEIAAGIANFPDSYFGEGTDTKADNELRINVFTYALKPMIRYSFNKAYSAGTFIDLRGRDEKTNSLSGR